MLNCTIVEHGSIVFGAAMAMVLNGVMKEVECIEHIQAEIARVLQI